MAKRDARDCRFARGIWKFLSAEFHRNGREGGMGGFPRQDGRSFPAGRPGRPPLDGWLRFWGAVGWGAACGRLHARPRRSILRRRRARGDAGSDLPFRPPLCSDFAMLRSAPRNFCFFISLALNPGRVSLFVQALWARARRSIAQNYPVRARMLGVARPASLHDLGTWSPQAIGSRGSRARSAIARRGFPAVVCAGDWQRGLRARGRMYIWGALGDNGRDKTLGRGKGS